MPIFLSRQFLNAIAAASVLLLLLLAASGCGVQLESEDDIAKTDPLYARVQSECGEDAVLLRALDAGAEAICCLQWTAIVPKLHCMTAKGGTVVNPETKSRLREVAEEPKIQ